MVWIDITQDLTTRGAEKLNVGQILIFDFEGSRTNLKITRKRNGKVWAKEVKLYELNEVEVTDKKKIDESFNTNEHDAKIARAVLEYQSAKEARKKK